MFKFCVYFFFFIVSSNGQSISVFVVGRLLLRGITKIKYLSFYICLICFGRFARRDNRNLEYLMVTGKIEGKRPRDRSPNDGRTNIGATKNTCERRISTSYRTEPLETYC